MSNPRLPGDLLDDVVDFLHDAPDVLGNCCLVSKLWIPRTRKYLFADITFHKAESLELWRKTFPDPSTSPACYTKSLSVGCPHAVTAADAQPGGWIRTFSHVLHLNVDRLYDDGSAVPLLLFRGFSPTLKSLHVHFDPLPPSQICDFILSFPLLEDLNATACESSASDGDGSHELLHAVQSVGLPRFTGTLELPGTGIKLITRQLLSLPGGIHFRRLVLRWFKVEDLSLAMALVEACSHTLESLDIGHVSSCTSTYVWVRVNNSILFLVKLVSASFNLFKVTKLRDVVFRLGSLTVEWITMVLQTITPNHQDLQHILIYVNGHILPPVRPGVRVRETVGREVFRQWSDLDRQLVQLWESRSIRLRVLCGSMGEYQRRMEYSIESLLPAASEEGMIDVVE